MAYQVPQNNKDMTRQMGSPASISGPTNINTSGLMTKTSAPAGYTPAPVVDGYKPSSSLQSFLKDSGMSIDTLMKHYPPGSKVPDIDNALNNIAGVTQANAGIYNKPEDGLVEIGTGLDGKKMYSAPELLSNPTNFMTGNNQLSTLGGTLDRLGVFKNKEEASSFAKYSTLASDPTFLGNITAAAAAGDKKGAVNLLMNQLGKPAIQELVTSQKQSDGVSTGFAAYNLINNWDRMNTAQRSMAVAGLGIKAYRFADGTDLATKVIIPPNSPGGAQLTVGGALGLIGAGMNINDLRKNWGQYDAMQRMTYGVGSASQLATTAKQFGLIGSEAGATTTSAAVSGLSAPTLGAAGFSSVPSAGVGAIVGPAGSLPSGYTAIASGANGTVVAVPQSLAGTTAATNSTSAAAGASTGGSSTVSILGTAAGVASIAYGAKVVYDGWGTGGKQGAVNGAIGGTTMAAGMYALGATNPYAMAGVVALSVMGNSIEMSKAQARSTSVAGMTATGAMIGSAVPGVGTAIGAAVGLVAGGVMYSMQGAKSEKQLARDSVRKYTQKIGLSDDKFNVTLADGSTSNIEIDGNGGLHQFKNPNMIPEGGENRDLKSYDVDYTNDLDFTANLGTNALVRLMSGGKGDHIDAIGGQLANAAISNIGFGQEMTDENFGKMQANLRAFYNKSGITSKADGYALANQAFAEERITEMDLIALHQGMNITFDDDGLATARTLMDGRWTGIKVAGEVPKAPGPNIVPKPLVTNAPAMTKPLVTTMSSSPAGMMNTALTAAGKPGIEEPIRVDFEWDDDNYWSPKGLGSYDAAMTDQATLLSDPNRFNAKATKSVVNKMAGSSSMTKEELRKFNANKFGSK